MATEDISNWRKWHNAEKIGVIGILNLPKGRKPEQKKESATSTAIAQCLVDSIY